MSGGDIYGFTGGGFLADRKERMIIAWGGVIL